jgi:sterol desaturase/sphingolipid hydroxylase (fatty acid hydroxylase superfamily)
VMTLIMDMVVSSKKVLWASDFFHCIHHSFFPLVYPNCIEQNFGALLKLLSRFSLKQEEAPHVQKRNGGRRQDLF